MDNCKSASESVVNVLQQALETLEMTRNCSHELSRKLGVASAPCGEDPMSQDNLQSLAYSILSLSQRLRDETNTQHDVLGAFAASPCMPPSQGVGGGRLSR